MKYRASDGSLWHIEKTSPPIPTHVYDWEWVADDYGGPGDDAHSNEPTMAACVGQIETWVQENTVSR